MRGHGMGHAGSGERGATPSERLLRGLLGNLLARTADGSVGWEVDDGHQDSYCLAGPDWLLATRSVDGDGTAPYALVVATAAGEAILEVRSTSPFGRPLSDLFAAVHSAAAASAALSAATPLLARITRALAAPPAEPASGRGRGTGARKGPAASPEPSGPATAETDPPDRSSTPDGA